MENQPPGITGEAASQQESSPLEGTINFSNYSLQQLKDFQSAIDRRAFPQNYLRLLQAIENLEAARAPGRPALVGVPGSFTQRDGVIGWLQAKRRRSPMFGAGAIEVLADGVMLRGWQRTWLGVPQQSEVFVAFGSIRNVAHDAATVQFVRKRRYWLSARVEFQAPSAAEALKLAASLPRTQTPGFERRWSELTDFNRRSSLIRRGGWATPLVVAANSIAFIAMLTQIRGPAGFTPDQLVAWGANFGPLTVNGQWWRLLTALFIHGNFLHLLLNMWALWNIGRLAERLYGSWTLLVLYLTTGAIASLTSVAWNPATPSVGASGAIFGVFGIFIAFLATRRSEVPRAVFRSHWLSTIIFVLFNLISGALQTGIDNAAHVGGLASGILLGWIMARPMDVQARLHFPAVRVLCALVAVAAISAAGISFSTGVGSQLTVPEQFFHTHDWFFSGETRNLASWNELSGQESAGIMSDAEFGRRFQSDVLPFWESAAARLQTETRAGSGAQHAYALLITDHVGLRVQLVQAIVDATVNNKAGSLDSVKSLAHQLDLSKARLERMQLRASLDHRPRALADSVLVVRVRNLFSNSGKKCVKEPPVWGPSVADTDSKTDAPALAAAAGCRAQRLFLSGDYPSLDQELSHYAATLKDLPDNGSTYAGMIGGLNDLFYYSALDINEALGRTSDWRRAVANPANADLIEALVFQQWAWAARGTGYAKEISAQAWAAFGHRVEMAAAALRDSATEAGNNPYWYVLSIDVGLDTSIGPDKLRAIFDKGEARFPGYLPLYSRMLRTLMPRWGGTYETVDAFIRDQSQKPGQPLDPALYATLYATYGRLEDDQANIFSDAKADWPIMKTGFEQLLSRFPASDAVLNLYARYACAANDLETYSHLRAQLAKRISASIWSNTITPQKCESQFANRFLSKAEEQMNLSNFPAAIEEANKTLAVDPKSDAAFADRGWAHMQEGENRLAEADFAAAAAINPRQAMVYRGRGVLASKAGRYTEAIAAFTKSLELEPDNAFALDQRAIAIKQAKMQPRLPAPAQ